MSTNFPVFSHPSFGSVRVFMKDGEPWFVANDVAKALGYSVPKDAVATHCDYARLFKGGDLPPLNNLNGLGIPPRGMMFIPESDVYALIFGSTLPAAKDFRTWVCEDVLPSIRKTGAYGYNLPAVPKSFPDALRMIADIEEEKQLAVEQRDYYKRTKAQIGSRREALTTASACGILNFPKPVRPCRSLCPSQAGDNRGVFCFCHQSTSRGVGYILAEQRPGVREAPAVSLDRGALFRLFVSNSQTSEVHHA